ncbi:MAG: hypothetical protein ABI612_03795 [Betaproteobacteria bacterium]
MNQEATNASSAFQTLRRRPSQDDLELSTECKAFLSSLEPALEPKELAGKYPRILNQVARLWRRPMQLDQYFEELLIDTRGNRQGFPMKIVLELSTLKEHYHRATFPVKFSIWDESSSSNTRR